VGWKHAFALLYPLRTVGNFVGIGFVFFRKKLGAEQKISSKQAQKKARPNGLTLL
jgi:hypothetical protein